jgi:hypothetical protein
MELSQVLGVVERGAAWWWIREQYLPAGPICPSCRNVITGPLALEAFALLKRTYCKSCGSNSPARAFIPVLRGTEWQPEEYIKFLFLHLAALHPSYIASLLGKSPACVRDMIDRQRIQTPDPLSGQLS